MSNAEKGRFWKNRDRQMMILANEGMERENSHLKKELSTI